MVHEQKISHMNVNPQACEERGLLFPTPKQTTKTDRICSFNMRKESEKRVLKKINLL